MFPRFPHAVIHPSQDVLGADTSSPLLVVQSLLTFFCSIQGASCPDLKKDVRHNTQQEKHTLKASVVVSHVFSPTFAFSPLVLRERSAAALVEPGAGVSRLVLGCPVLSPCSIYSSLGLQTSPNESPAFRNLPHGNTGEMHVSPGAYVSPLVRTFPRFYIFPATSYPVIRHRTENPCTLSQAPMPHLLPFNPRNNVNTGAVRGNPGTDASLFERNLRKCWQYIYVRPGGNMYVPGGMTPRVKFRLVLSLLLSLLFPHEILSHVYTPPTGAVARQPKH